MVDFKIEWSPKALKQASAHYLFLAQRNERKALSLYNTLKTAPSILKTFPHIGQIEPSLVDSPICYRYLLVGSIFKIIYSIEDDYVQIHAVWDCRQNEDTLKQTVSK